MQFEIWRFHRFAKYVYDGIDAHPYDYWSILSLFQYYFEKYEERTHQPHPPLNTLQIERFINKFPYIFGKDGDVLADISQDENRMIIDKYFETKFPNCDYNINHFFSGRIREIKYFEACY